MTILIPILGDQLSHGLSSLAGQDKKESVILMAEVDEETEYVPHHKSKMAYILSAMRHHAEDLRSAGWIVDYVKLTDANNSGSFTGEVARAIERHKISALRVTEAGEWRVKAMLDSWPDRFDMPVTILPDDRFLCTHGEFESWAKDRKQFRMEFFYRDMRRKSGLLMNGDAPEGGQWNFDSENRKPAKRDLTMPRPLHFAPNAVTQDVIQMVEARYGDNIGQTEKFSFAVTRKDALQQQQHFLAHALPHFGDYQDAMLTDEPFYGTRSSRPTSTPA